MNDTNILLVRHTDVHNPDQIFYGRLPRFRLSNDGEAQAEATAEYLANLHPTAIYSSPMLRARQTAKVIATRHPGLRVRVARALIEVGTTWQGTPWTVIGADANLYEPLKAPGDETMDAIADRMEAFIHRLRRRHAGETVVCVSHADPVMIARVRLQGIALSMRAIRAADYPERGSVTRLRFGDDGSLEVSYSSPAQSLIKPAQAAKREAPAEASGEAAK